MVKNCSTCGAENKENAQFCFACGNEFPGNNTSNTQEFNTFQNKESYEMVPTESKMVKYKDDDKEKIVAGLLAIFLGGLGIHRFYLGEKDMGIIYLLFCWTMIPGLIAIIEGILYLTMSDIEFDRKYNR